MAKKSTIHDIARELNITASTVSRALSDNPRISAETKRLVKAAALRTGYQLNGVAAALRSGRTHTIGMIVPTTDRSFFASITRGIEEVANNSGYNLMICQSNDRHEAELKGINALLRAQVDGIVLSIAKETTNFQHIENLKNQGIPLVLFDRVPYDADISTVTIDDYNGAYKATEHLIQQGCRRVAVFAGEKQHINIFKERLRGYMDALSKFGISPQTAYIQFNDLTLQGGRTSAAALCALPNPPDGLFCASDYSAMGAMQYFKEQGIQIPEQIALIGFSNEPFTAFVDPPLTTIDQHPIEMGRTIAKLFLDQIDPEKTDDNPKAKHIILNPDLIVRTSSLFKK